MPDAGFLATVLLIVGLFLLGLEFFIPSFGMIGTMSIVSLVVSFWCAWKAWGGGANPTFFWTYVVVFVAGVPGTFFGAISLIERTPLGKHIVLQPSEAPPAEEPLKTLLGRRGVAQTLLTPGGMILIDGERYHGESVGMLVDPRTPVIIVGVTGNRVIVRPLQADELSDDSAAVSHEPAVSHPATVGQAKQLVEPASLVEKSEDRMDFDIPSEFRA